jgi:predicted aspartyl protease
MGRVTTAAVIENLGDLYAVNQGFKQPEQVRRITVADALVDTGAMVLSLPSRLIKQLGLNAVTPKETMTAGGPRQTTMYEAVRLTIQDRFCSVDVLEVPDNVPVLIGQVPLEVLDFVVHPQKQQLVGNPAHGGKQMFEMY